MSTSFLGWLKTFGGNIGAKGTPISVADQNDNAVPIRALVNGQVMATARAFEDAIVENDIIGYKPLKKGAYFKHSGDMSSYELFSGYPSNEQTSPAVRSIVSSSTQDAGLSSGVSQVLLRYLTGTHEEKEEVISLNGTTPVNTSNLDIQYVNSFEAKSVGSLGAAAGDIILMSSFGGEGVEITRIKSGELFCECGRLYTPWNYDMYISHISIRSSGKGLAYCKYVKRETVGGVGVDIKTETPKVYIPDKAAVNLINDIICIPKSHKLEIWYKQTSNGGKYWTANIGGWYKNAIIGGPPA